VTVNFLDRPNWRLNNASDSRLDLAISKARANRFLVCVLVFDIYRWLTTPAKGISVAVCRQIP
jgi:hypothetical protein